MGGKISIRAAALAAVVALGAAMLLPMAGQADLPATLPNEGVLRLAPDGNNLKLVWQKPFGTTVATQQVRTQRGCTLAPASGGTNGLVNWTTPSGSYPGLFSQSIGTGSNQEGNGTPCGQVNNGQSLTMSLAGQLAGKEIAYAELDLEFKFGTTVKIEGYLGAPSTTNPAVVTQTYTKAGTDSGPDSGPNDNEKIRFPLSGQSAFDTIVFSVEEPADGAFSLEAGTDGTPALTGGFATTDSVFQLTDVVRINCNQQQTLNTQYTVNPVCTGSKIAALTVNSVATPGGQSILLTPITTTNWVVLERITFDAVAVDPDDSDQIQWTLIVDDTGPTYGDDFTQPEHCLVDPRVGAPDNPTFAIASNYDTQGESGAVLPSGDATCIVEATFVTVGNDGEGHSLVKPYYTLYSTADALRGKG